MNRERIRKHLDRGLEEQRSRDLHARVLPIYGSFCVITVLGTVVAVLHAPPLAGPRILAILGVSIAAFVYLSSRVTTSTNTERLLVPLHTVVRWPSLRSWQIPAER